MKPTCLPLDQHKVMLSHYFRYSTNLIEFSREVILRKVLCNYLYSVIKTCILHYSYNSSLLYKYMVNDLYNESLILCMNNAKF